MKENQAAGYMAKDIGTKAYYALLFADDNAKVLELLRSSFEKLGIKITTCITMDEVSESLINEDADVLVVEENIEGKKWCGFLHVNRRKVS